MSAAGARSLDTACRHAEVDLDRLLAGDRLAAALAVPLVPGTYLADLRMWLLRVYRHVAGSAATVEGACALLHQHPVSGTEKGSLCLVVRVGWKQSGEDLALSDIGNAQRLAAWCGTQIAYDSAAGWRIWADSAWQPDPEGAVVQRWAKTVSRGIAKEAEALHWRARVEADRDDADAEEASTRLANQAKQATSWALKSQSAERIAAMIKLVRDEPGVLTRSEQWDADPWLLACQGATVELREDGHVIRSSRRADRLTRVGRICPDPGALAPEWDRFLTAALPDPAVRSYLQRLTGYSLFGANPRRLLVILIGPTSTGKSTYGEIIMHVLGEHGGCYDFSLFRPLREAGPRPDLVDALGRRILFASEAAERWHLYADEVKRLTGSDTLPARGMYARTFTYRRPSFTPWLLTNTVPTIIGADQAVWRRLTVIPWTRTVDPAQEDEHLGARIRENESAGVLRWMLEGWDAYTRDGLGEVPTSCIGATMRVREDLSPLDCWIAEETEQGAEYSAPSEELWNAYRLWCQRSGVSDQDRGNAITFGRALSAHGFRHGFEGPKSARRRTRVGLRLRGAHDFAQHD